MKFSAPQELLAQVADGEGPATQHWLLDSDGLRDELKAAFQSLRADLPPESREGIDRAEIDGAWALVMRIDYDVTVEDYADPDSAHPDYGYAASVANVSLEVYSPVGWPGPIGPDDLNGQPDPSGRRPIEGIALRYLLADPTTGPWFGRQASDLAAALEQWARQDAGPDEDEEPAWIC